MEKNLSSLDSVQAVDAAITSRRSVRAYLPDPVPREMVEDILSVARRAPSGTNAQPWHVHVLTGAARDRLSQAILAEAANPEAAQGHVEEYAYYPKEWFSPYLDRRRKVGWDLYGLLGIERGDKSKISAQNARNYVFFDAPVGLIFTIDRRLGQGSWLDYGMFLQNIMVAARARGLDTCPQAAFTRFHRVIAAQLALPSELMVVCGMALGWADPNAIENTLTTDREPLEQFTRYIE
jgi:nitroreductase